MIIRRILVTCAIATVGLGSAGSAATVSNSLGLFQGAAGDPGCGSSPSLSETRSSSFSLSLADGAAHCSLSAQGFVSAGVVGITGTVSTSPVPGGNARVRASGSTTISGIEISAAPGFSIASYTAANGFFIPVQLNAQATGSVSASVDVRPGFVRTAGASLEGTAILQGNFNSNQRRDENIVRASFGIDNNGNTSGDTVFGGALLPTISADLRGTLSVTFRLNGSAGTFTNSDTNGTATFNSFNSLGFATDGPAFILPEGFTVNAPEIGIINNRWIDPRATVDPGPSPVPLPAGLPLALLGLASLGLLRRR